MKHMKWLPLILFLLVGCAQSAGQHVAGNATAQPALIATAQADEYVRDAHATLQARDQEAQALAWRLQATAAAATTAAQHIQAVATATAAQAMTASALAWSMTTDAATAQAVATATQQARLDVAATSQAHAEATAVAATATIQAYAMQQAEAEAARERAWSAAVTILLIIAAALLLAAVLYVAWRLLPTINNRASVIRYGQHGNPLIVSNHNGRTVITEPLRMLQASLQIDQDGQPVMPQLSPEDVQAFVAGGVLRVLMEQAAHAPGHAPQLPAETINERGRRVGPVETSSTTTTRYAPPVVTRLPTETAGLPSTPAAALPFYGGSAPLLAAAPQQPLALIDAALRQNNILLGIEEGQAITAPVRDLCHVGIAGATGGGKSTILRLLLAQLLASGASVVLADPHYADVDPKSGDDWRAIRSHLHMPPAFRYRDIRDMLTWLVGEMERRLQMRRDGQAWANSLFLAFDEYPLIAQNIPEAADLVGRILREGRKVDVLAVGAFQDALVRSIGGDGAVRENYRTAYYTGGDQHTARVLMDIRGRVDDSVLGHGAALLRSPATTPARRVQVPRLDNGDIVALLPASTQAEGAFGSGKVLEVAHFGSGPEGAAEGEPEGAVREQQVLQMLRAGSSISEVIRALWDATGGRRYQEAAAFVGGVIQRNL